QVSTHINSGNLLLSSPGRAAAVVGALEAAIEERFGFAVPVIVRTETQLRAVLEVNPYPDGDPSRVTIAFLAEEPAPDALDRIAAVATAAERFARVGEEVVVEFGDGQARSKLAAQLPRLLGVEATVRNLRTVRSLVEMLAG